MVLLCVFSALTIRRTDQIVTGGTHQFVKLLLSEKVLDRCTLASHSRWRTTVSLNVACNIAHAC